MRIANFWVVMLCSLEFLLETVDSRATVRLEGLSQLKKKISTPGIETATFQLVV
jgi:hypothetical protein